MEPHKEGLNCSKNEECSAPCQNKYGPAYRTGLCLGHYSVRHTCLCELWQPDCQREELNRTIIYDELCVVDRDCQGYCDKYPDRTPKCILDWNLSDGRRQARKLYQCSCVLYSEKCELRKTGQEIYLDDAGPSSKDGGKYYIMPLIEYKYV